MRLIDAEAFIEEAERHYITISWKDTPFDVAHNMGRMFRGLIENAPTVTQTETTDFGAMIAKTNAEIERLVKELDEHMKTMKDELWRNADDPPDAFFDENIGLIPFLVCLDGTEYPFRAVYDGANWSDGISASVLPVKWWMPIPKPPRKEEP